ncbi:MAG: protein kinase [Anaerolineae bacterium]
MIGKRYLLHEQLGVGGMGTVHRALDRLTGETVALKQVVASAERLQFGQSGLTVTSAAKTKDMSLALAQEFKLLASLRHPNIISVLDYGFDQQKPFFTMELLDHPRTITEAGREQSLDVQVDLLMQLLQALVYLHRRGIIHRDLKPTNVLVIESDHGQLVKALDFGLSMTPRDHEDNDSSTAGTLGYMAPEVLTGGFISPRADLYAFGIIAYELFTGRHPFDPGDIVKLIHNIFESEPDLSGIPERLAVVLQRLMAKSPESRYESAAEVIEALSQATGQDIPQETAAIRESYLQAAELVGRDHELIQLTDAMQKAIDRHGSVWLVGGESGVGKSRLLEELRTQALVRGALVLRGQCISEGGALYAPWRPALRWMSLFTPLEDREARVLKTLVPDISDLLGRAVGDAPELSPLQGQERLLSALLGLFKRQQQPIVLILEDLQWANAESLEALARLTKLVDSLPLLVVGSFRDDESPHLPEQLPLTHLLKLRRLSQQGIARLSEAMIGEAGRQPHIVEMLHRETEGNVFFIVEVVRALAEEAGQLDRIGKATLPQHVFTGGVKRIVQRRIDRVPGEARPLLEFAAIAGYYLDMNVMRVMMPRDALEVWLHLCAEAQVLDVTDGDWRFMHEKLRTGLLATMGDNERRALHEQVALATEYAYANAPEHVASLAYHWQMAGNTDKTMQYTILAGDQAMRSGANREATDFYWRALAYLSVDDPQRVEITLKLANVSTYHMPDNMLELLQGALALTERLEDDENFVRVLSSLGAYYHIKGQTGTAISYFEKSISIADRLQTEHTLLLPYNIIGRTYAVSGNFPDALPLLQRGITLAEHFHDEDMLSASLAYSAQTNFIIGSPNDGWRDAMHALELSQGNPNRFAADLAVVGWGLAFSGQFDRAREYLEHSLSLSHEMNLDLPMITACGSLGYIALKEGDYPSSLEYLETAIQEAVAHGNVFHLPLYQLYRAELDLLHGNVAESLDRAEDAFDLAEINHQEIALSEFHVLLAKSYAENHDWDKALEIMNRGIDMHLAYSRLPFAVDALLALTRMHMTRRQTHSAIATLDKTLYLLNQVPMPLHLEAAQQLQQNIGALT